MTYSIANIEQIEEEFQEVVNCEDMVEINHIECENISTFIKETFMNAKLYVSNYEQIDNERNAYRNEDYCKDSIELCIELPVWSKIMLKPVHTNDDDIAESPIKLSNSYKDELQQYLLPAMPNVIPTVDQYLLK